MTHSRIKLIEGEWQIVFADFQSGDVLAADPPYSPKTHKGQRTGSSVADPTIDYASMSPAHAAEIAEFFAPRIRHWAILFGDHISWQWHADAWAAQGWYVFAPVLWVRVNPPPRFSGDGPTKSSEHIMVARPKREIEKHRRGSRPGHYYVRNGSGVPGLKFPGVKYLPTMVDLIEDYTIEGDLVVDPFAGTGTTLVAAASVQCYGVGAERNPETAEVARNRIARGYTPKILDQKRAKPSSEQLALA